MKAASKAVFRRRNFIKIAAGVTGLSALAHSASSFEIPIDKGVYVIGPMEGYSPHIGTLVSMLNYNRHTVVNAVKSLTMAEIDHLQDANANSIAALVMHLGAIDKYYQVNTFEGRQELNENEKRIWGAAMNLGNEGRKQIKGQEIKYYLDMISEVRAKTLEEFKKKDDKWLLTVDPEWSKEEPLNTYWKWFHVCEHEANHRGQITWLKGRLPGAKPGKE